MATYIVRVVLHRKTSEKDVPVADYDLLHAKMEKRNFLREVEDEEGNFYRLPPAEYCKITEGNLSANAIWEHVNNIIKGMSLGRKFAILCSKTDDVCWGGLDEA